MKIRTLIVEDESLIRWSIRQKFEDRGYEVVEAENGHQALAAADAAVFDLVILDFKLPDMTGIDILRKLRESESDAVFIMMTAYSTIENAVEAIKLGAYDYISKPFQIEHLMFIVDKALETTKLRREIRELRRDLEREYGTSTIIGQDPSMSQLMEMVTQIARTGATTVFLRGETGTGKDLVARAIHQQSDRAARPFVNITCTALSETLLESELFGHERGAFTDAKQQKKGLLELADGGTVFLDEIGDMPAALQAKLLRFLEERKFRRVGGTREIAVDVRVIAATNRDIEKAIEDGKFRNDLLYRLNVVTVELPPLRGRGNDVHLLARHFAQRFAQEFKRDVRDFDESACAKLQAYGWPGNVRELRNTIERAVLLCRGPIINANDIVVGKNDTKPLEWDLEHFELPGGGFDFEKLQRLEKNLLLQALDRSHQNQSQAAKMLCLSRDRLRYRMQKHGLL